MEKNLDNECPICFEINGHNECIYLNCCDKYIHKDCIDKWLNFGNCDKCLYCTNTNIYSTNKKNIIDFIGLLESNIQTDIESNTQLETNNQLDITQETITQTNVTREHQNTNIFICKKILSFFNIK